MPVTDQFGVTYPHITGSIDKVLQMEVAKVFKQSVYYEQLFEVITHHFLFTYNIAIGTNGEHYRVAIDDNGIYREPKECATIHEAITYAFELLEQQMKAERDE